jgi:hypothetical protein
MTKRSDVDVKNHNRGPIGPLDPNEPPPKTRREDRLRARELVKVLQSMGVEITERDLEYYHASGEGPPHTMAPGQRTYTLGEALDWTGHTFPVPELNRKEATKYICEELGYYIGPTVLSQLAYSKSGGPPFVIRGRDAYYTKEGCKKWVEADRARGARRTPAPRYLPVDATRRCPEGYLKSFEKGVNPRALLRATNFRGPPEEHKRCPFVKHKRCAKYPRALCNLIHLPLDPALYPEYEARGIIQLLITRRPDAHQIEAYIAAFSE